MGVLKKIRGKRGRSKGDELEPLAAAGGHLSPSHAEAPANGNRQSYPANVPNLPVRHTVDEDGLYDVHGKGGASIHIVDESYVAFDDLSDFDEEAALSARDPKKGSVNKGRYIHGELDLCSVMPGEEIRYEYDTKMERTQYEYCMTWEWPAESADLEEKRVKLLAKLRAAELIVDLYLSRDRDTIFVCIGAELERLARRAEIIGASYKCNPIVLPSPPGAPLGKYKLNHMFSPFTRAEAKEGKFKFGGEHVAYSKRRQQLVLNIMRAKPELGGAGIVPRDLLHDEIIRQLFPLHEDSKLEHLVREWATAFTSFSQPLEDINDYFGEKVAFYFAWLGHYTTYLWAPAILGAILFAAAKGKAENEFIPYYCIFLALWSATFLEFWKRRNSELSLVWGVTDYEQRERDRPEYYGDNVFNPYTGQWETRFATTSRLKKYAFTVPAVFFCILVVVAVLVCVIIFRKFITKISAQYGGVAAGMVNAISIMLLNKIYRGIAVSLNDTENHRTDTIYENSLIVKTFAFGFVNSYISLFYMAFVDRDMHELSTQLGALLITSQIVNNIMEVGMPYAKRKLKMKMEDRTLSKEGDFHVISAVGRQAKLDPYETLTQFDDYAEMVIQFGYVVCFSSAFPLAAVCALINNIFEIRVDAYKLCREMKRPEMKRASSIGTWFVILDIMTVVGIIVNSGILGYTSTQLEVDFGITNLKDRIIACFVAEHAILFIRILMQNFIPDEPAHVALELRGQQQWAEQAQAKRTENAVRARVEENHAKATSVASGPAVD